MADVTRQSIESSEPVKVGVGSVEQALAKLWRQAMDGVVPGLATPGTRTILSNLLVYAASDAEADQATRIVSEIIADHPARVIVTSAGTGELGDKVEADVAMLCNIAESGRRLCGETIRLHAPGAASAVFGVVLPVLVPDLPIYLWTPGDLVWNEEFLHNLTQISDHWIIDSRNFTKWSDRFQLAVSLGPGDQPPVALHDLAWTSLSQWRTLVAQHFDPWPARDYLRGVTRVEIAYKPFRETKPNIESILMAAWLMSRLGWEDPRAVQDSDTTWTILTHGNGNRVSIRLKVMSDAQLPIEQVTIESDLDGRHGVFRCVRGDRPDEVSLEAEAPDVAHMRRTVYLDQPSLSRDIRRVLDGAVRDTWFEKALPAIQQLIMQIEGSPLG